MASQAIKIAVTSTSDVDIVETTTWTHIWAQLESDAVGVNQIGYNTGYTKVEPGATISHWVAPGTQIKIQTTSATDVEWSFLITPMSILEDLLTAICELGG